MTASNIFQSNPLLRLALPLIAGIAVGYLCNVEALHLISIFVVSVILLLVGAFRIAPKWLFGLGAAAVMFSLGLFAEHEQSKEKSVLWSERKQNYSAQLLEVPAVRGTNVKVLARLVLNAGENVQGERTSGDVYLYFPRTVETELLKVGDVVSFDGVVLPPENRGNPAEFDIEKYYYIKGFSGTAFVPADGWNYLPAGRKSLQMYALELRSRVVGLYEKLGFEGEELALLSALTLGEKRDFPQELKESYSAAGASHVLALSGLHLGILYMLLAFVVPVGRSKFIYRFLRELFIVLFLWAFAFVAGLSPSVVRSATLFTLMSAGRLFGQDVSPVSSLSFAAIAMLLLAPHMLFDVSFQLSFSAVLSILLLAPELQNLLRVHEHGRVYEYVMNLIILSLVAQLGTFPFIWYYFGMFPIYFLLTNVFVVPLAFVVMALAVAVWVLTPLWFLQQPVAYILKLAVSLMNKGVEMVAALPGASFALPTLDVLSAIMVTLLTILLLVSLLQRKWWLFAISSACSVVLLVVAALFSPSEGKGNYMVIYNNKKNPLLHLVCENGGNYLLSTIPQGDAQYEYVSEPFLKREGLSVPLWAEWGYADERMWCDDGMVAFDGLTVRLLDNTHWRDNDWAMPVDILVLCRGFLGKVSEVVEVYPPSCLVVDGSLYKRSRERIMRECAQLGIDAVDISALGAVKVVPGNDSFDLIPMRGK